MDDLPYPADRGPTPSQAPIGMAGNESASRLLHVASGHVPSNSCVAPRGSRFPWSHDKLGVCRCFAMTWFRAFALAFPLLFVTALACSRGPLSAVQTVMPTR